MAVIRIKLRDGTVRDFPDVRRPGGSYTNSVKFEAGWVIVKDSWDERTAFPASEVAEVIETPSRY